MQYLVVLDAEVYPKMPRKKSKAVPVGNGPVPQDIYIYGLLGRITMGDLHRIMSEALDKALDKSFDELKKNLDRCQKLLP